jgi:DNA adenine methylase
MSRNIRPLMKRHGGKYYLIDDLNALTPDHRTSVETHVGGGSWSLNKRPAEHEIINDIDVQLMNTWKCIRDSYDHIVYQLSAVTYTEATWNDHIVGLTHHDPIVRAIGTIVKYRMSRGGLGGTFGWSDRLRGGQPGDVNAWQTFVRDELPKIKHRIKRWIIYDRNAIDLVALYGDDTDTLFYCDPPYVQETRTTKKAYGTFEMTPKQHYELLSALHKCKAMAMVSGYRSDLYDTLLRDWTRYDRPMKNNAGQGRTKRDRVESIWMKG